MGTWLSAHWQDAAVTVAAVAALAVLIRRRLRKKSCDACALAEAVRNAGPAGASGAAPSRAGTPKGV